MCKFGRRTLATEIASRSSEQWALKRYLTMDALQEGNLLEADLQLANLLEADLRGANLLTQAQINSAVGDERTELPEGLDRPSAWSKSTDEQPNGDK